MARVDWESDDRSFRFWGLCIVVASLIWIGYWLLGGMGISGGVGASFKTLSMCLGAPAAMISLYAFQLGRRQARRRRERRG